MVRDGADSGRKGDTSGQTLPALPCSMEDSKAGLAKHYENLFIKVGRENRSYLIVFCLGLHILNIHTYVSGPPFVFSYFEPHRS